MRPLRYSINVTLDGCCDHRAFAPDEDLHRHAAENLAKADALLFGRVTYEMMEVAWRSPQTGARPDWMEPWMEPFARTIDAAKKYVVSSTLDRVDWNAKLVRELKEELGLDVEVQDIGPPKMVTVTATVGLTSGHTDVSLWYVVQGDRSATLEFDEDEFNEVRWFPFSQAPVQRSDPHLGRFLAKIGRTDA